MLKRTLVVGCLVLGGCMSRGKPFISPLVLWDTEYSPTTTNPVELTADPNWSDWWPIRELYIYRHKGMYSREAVMPEILKYAKQEGGHAFLITDDGKSIGFVTLQNGFGATRTGVAPTNAWRITVYRRTSAR